EGEVLAAVLVEGEVPAAVLAEGEVLAAVLVEGEVPAAVLAEGEVLAAVLVEGEVPAAVLAEGVALVLAEEATAVHCAAVAQDDRHHRHRAADGADQALWPPANPLQFSSHVSHSAMPNHRASSPSFALTSILTVIVRPNWTHDSCLIFLLA
ncbi:MAG: hypothetical protein AB7K41_11130, partial [Bdellovibrionales bacterium]